MPTKERIRRKTVINVGCGPFSVFDTDSYRGHLLQFYPPKDWKEVRVDLNPDVKPDVIADACELPFEAESLDSVVCLACLEHLVEEQAGQALLEFNRVLKIGGTMIVQVPDLGAAAQMIVEDRLCEVIYESDAGPVRALDLIYGHQRMTPNNPFMCHKTGFTVGTLATWLWECGFDGRVDRTDADIWAYVAKIQSKERNAVSGSLYRQPKPAD